MIKNFILLCFLFLASMSVRAQDINELSKRNGYKDIKLGSLIDSVRSAVFQKDLIVFKEFEAKLYEITDDSYKKIGDAEVKKVEVKTYKGLIYEIIVTTPKDPRIMRGLEKLYGKAAYSLRTESYSWKVPDQISLVYKGHHKEVTLTYRSHSVVKIMYADKKKKIEEVAEDF